VSRLDFAFITGHPAHPKIACSAPLHDPRVFGQDAS
jgi:hypothetical protein